MPALTQFQLSLTGATWIDVNSMYTQDANPDRLPDVLAVSNSIFNILNCAIGARARTFQPEYGSLLYQFLQEPIDLITGNSINTSLIQALARWEPRIAVDTSKSFVQPDYSIIGYNVRIAFTLLLTSNKSSVSFNLVQ